jgi:Collagen triple helix repeat (20 copies)
VGPAGPEGPQGPNGPQGPQGPNGPQGPTGPGGATGPQGAAGGTGPQGTAGAQGLPGPAGPKGDRGPRGRRGPVGETPKVTCGSRGAERRVRCRVIVGGGESRVALRLRLSRNGDLYATGARIARSRRTNVRLHALRRIQPGRYTLLVVVGDGVRVRVPLRVR